MSERPTAGAATEEEVWISDIDDDWDDDMEDDVEDRCPGCGNPLDSDAYCEFCGAIWLNEELM